MFRITPGFLWKIAQHYLHERSLLNSQQHNVSALVPSLNQWLPFYKIDSDLRLAHFLAQSCVETANFSSLTERARNGGKEYEYNTAVGRALGNKYPGDGPKYIGRGMLHLTGRENYDQYGRILHEDLVNHPGLVSSNPDVAVRTACEFWHKRHVNIPADRDDFKAVTYAVNGGYNGLVERKRALDRIKNEMGI
ncbi:glycoside hydrolase family 19 protein [Pantoea sp. AS-PWVM4]|uniref:glycoside hydrolase family 19 protein n=1 Tax=Pantoea sp. AS-PWVM4 TaxID=1332069 RepID=UPI00055ADF43|nr:glycoside hydrolase family 19 protein [Pantoea sp. AS-PWVM4]